MEISNLQEPQPETTPGNPDHIKATQAPVPSIKPRSRGKKAARDYARIHSRPLPVLVHAVPSFHPTQPLSLIRLAYTCILQFFIPPPLYPPDECHGVFLPEARAIHIPEPHHGRMLWEMGFFGKGILSRSEPSWLEREKARLEMNRASGGTAEEARDVRREERRRFKLERARVEREKIEQQRMIEQGHVSVDDQALSDGIQQPPQPDPAVIDEKTSDQANDVLMTTGPDESQSSAELAAAGLEQSEMAKGSCADRISEDRASSEHQLPQFHIEEKEHLQLTPEEAFFLSYGLGALRILPSSRPGENGTNENRSFTNRELFHLFTESQPIPNFPQTRSFLPDNKFLVNYVVYHHFRSLGWVVRPGVKFSVDYLLYNRGPVFSHAEFAVLVIPSYSDAFWQSEAGKSHNFANGNRDWWWIHCVNRVQSQVRKSLVLVYVDIPPVFEVGGLGIGDLLKRYMIREFVVRRWLANRSRD